MKLQADNVEKVIKDCMFDKKIMDEDAIKIEGIVNSYVFSKKKLEIHKNDIKDMLEQLPQEFKEGWSFLMACNDKYGNQWGEHIHIEELVCLGISIRKVSMMPRQMWCILPGGMPYFTVKSEPENKSCSSGNCCCDE